MRRIYQHADNVIIWLGASTQEINRLFHWMRCLEDWMHTDGRQYPLAVWKRQWKSLGWQADKETHYSIRKGLQDLLGREWFFRIWVIQEAAFARAALITCGGNTVRSNTFVSMPRLLDVNCNENVQSRLEIMPGLLRRTSWWSGPGSQDLGTLLRKFGKSRATDPRDIIYALLGLSKDAYTSDIVYPNYEFSLEEAIQRTMAYLLITQSGQRCICPAYNHLPTWDMGEFLWALNDLPSLVQEWILEHNHVPGVDASFPWAGLGGGHTGIERHTGMVPIVASPWLEMTRKERV